MNFSEIQLRLLLNKSIFPKLKIGHERALIEQARISDNNFETYFRHHLLFMLTLRII